MRLSSSPTAGLPPKTPIEPVSVPGWATMTSAAMETKYPPDAARSPIEMITGLPALRVSTTSRQMASEATYEPPGLSTRNTTALTLSSRRAARKAAQIVSEPMAPPPPSGLRPLRPRRIMPLPWMSATTRSPGCGSFLARAPLAYRETNSSTSPSSRTSSYTSSR